MAAKLRKQKSLTSSMTLFATSSPHDTEGYFRKSHFHHFAVPTNDTMNILKVVEHAMSQLYKPDVRYYRCGVGSMGYTMKRCFNTICLPPQMTTINSCLAWTESMRNMAAQRCTSQLKGLSKSLPCGDLSYRHNTQQSGAIYQR